MPTMPDTTPSQIDTAASPCARREASGDQDGRAEDEALAAGAESDACAAAAGEESEDDEDKDDEDDESRWYS